MIFVGCGRFVGVKVGVFYINFYYIDENNTFQLKFWF